MKCQAIQVGPFAGHAHTCGLDEGHLGVHVCMVGEGSGVVCGVNWTGSRPAPAPAPVAPAPEAASRSQLRREAIQRGEPMPSFEAAPEAARETELSAEDLARLEHRPLIVPCWLAERVVAVYKALRAALAAPVPAAPEAASETESEDVSVICRDCGYLISGVEAGARVKWVVCHQCSTHAQEVAELRAALAAAETEKRDHEAVARKLDGYWTQIADILGLTEEDEGDEPWAVIVERVRAERAAWERAEGALTEIVKTVNASGLPVRRVLREISLVAARAARPEGREG